MHYNNYWSNPGFIQGEGNFGKQKDNLVSAFPTLNLGKTSHNLLVSGKM